jgi:hypothetical protein
MCSWLEANGYLLDCHSDKFTKQYFNQTPRYVYSNRKFMAVTVTHIFVFTETRWGKILRHISSRISLQKVK